MITIFIIYKRSDIYIYHVNFYYIYDDKATLT